MRTLITLVVVLFCLQLWAQVPDTTSVAPGRLIIKVNQAFQTIGTRTDGIIETEQTWFNDLAIQYQVNELRHLYAGSSLSGLQNKYLVCFPENLDLEIVTASFELQSQVQNVRYDLIFHLCTNDPFNSYQWNLQRINANDGYYTLANSIALPPNAEPVRIAVVDTGIDYNQLDLTNNILRIGNDVIGYNFVDQGQPFMDDNGHGTLVAGLIAAQTNNTTGISSLVTGNNVKLMPIKAFAQDNIGHLSDICEGISWSLSQGANVINCSWVNYVNDSNGEHNYPYDLEVLVDNHLSVLFVAARGNTSYVLPASWADDKPNVIAVGGSDINNTSEYGPAEWINICAPSGSESGWTNPHDSEKGIISTLPIYNVSNPYQMHYTLNSNLGDPYYSFQFGSWPNIPNYVDYDFYKGTSLSAAHVSGLAGMLFAQHYSELTSQPPSWYAENLKNIIIKSTQDFNSNTYSDYNNWGSGIINAYEALMPEHPNLSLRQYQIGPDDIDDRYNYPLDEYVWNLPSMEWGSSQPIKLQIKNKWEEGTNVRVQMSTTDPNITFTYPGDNDRYTIGNIAAEETIWTENMWIRDWSNQVRTNVPITISISANDMPNRVYTLSINVLQNTAAIVGSIPMLPNETITTDLVVSNLDGIGDDELLVGTSAGRLFCYKNNAWNYVGTLPQSITVNPSIGDINADGYKEIVALDLIGNVYVYDKTFVPQRTFPGSLTDVTLGSVMLEDVTGDNIFDIIYCINGTSFSEVKVIDYSNLASYSHRAYLNILAATAIGDVDNEPGYEIVVPYSDNSTGALRFRVLRFNNGALDVAIDRLPYPWPVESMLPPCIVDINEDGSPEIYWMMNSSNGNAYRYYYSVPNDCVIDSRMIASATFYSHEVAKIIDLTTNVASLYSYSTTINNPEPQVEYKVAIANGLPSPPSGWSVNNPMSSKTKNIITDELFPAEPGYYQQQVVLLEDNMISYYRLSYNQTNPASYSFSEIWDYATDFGESVSMISMATANRGLNRVLYTITDDGMLYSYSFTNSTSRKTDCAQRGQTSRHTGCYEQPIPQVITSDYSVMHPFVVDKATSIYSSVFTINEGVIGRFESGKSISAKRIDITPDFNIYGSEDNPVILRGLGSGTSNDFWNGLILNNDSNLHVNWAEVYGAHQALDISGTGSRFVKNSKFINNYQNINCYNSIVNFYYNYITDAIHGVSAYHFAGPMLNNTLTSHNGLNEIAGNEYGVFSDSSTPVLTDGHNNLDNDRYNLYLQNLPLMSGPIHAENNWWGHTDLREVSATINPVNRVAFRPYDMQPNQTIIREDQDSSMFEVGYAFMLNGEYHNAINSFIGVLVDSLINESDVVSLYAMFECYNQLGEITLFETQLDQYITDADYSLIHKPMKNVRALIYRETERFSLAIDHYESILLDNPAFQDSCYAVIDLGDTYLESNGRSSGQLTQYIPVSYALHQQNREVLLSSISQLSETENSADTTPPLQLLGNYPNPFNPTTTIRFQMKTDSNVKLEIYNIKGQNVTTLLNENRPAGLNSVVWNGKDRKNSPVASGVYFYRIESSDYSKTAKMLLLK